MLGSLIYRSSFSLYIRREKLGIIYIIVVTWSVNLPITFRSFDTRRICPIKAVGGNSSPAPRRGKSRNNHNQPHSQHNCRHNQPQKYAPPPITGSLLSIPNEPIGFFWSSQDNR